MLDVPGRFCGLFVYSLLPFLYAPHWTGSSSFPGRVQSKQDPKSKYPPGGIFLFSSIHDVAMASKPFLLGGRGSPHGSPVAAPNLAVTWTGQPMETCSSLDSDHAAPHQPTNNPPSHCQEQATDKHIAAAVRTYLPLGITVVGIDTFLPNNYACEGGRFQQLLLKLANRASTSLARWLTKTNPGRGVSRTRRTYTGSAGDSNLVRILRTMHPY
ncbi:hypothetical protein QBC37DRAFT_71429 [Rhypophila decipiens]|uniref:Uncharacterized protein n=1 Tax=Rhypophila decipiens TaxID=261697 RepID=A0AAN6YJP5_9PEZI|nr:hypothetical protein QBC37DRAFT_71429 [Rhypophila decipiens]